MTPSIDSLPPALRDPVTRRRAAMRRRFRGVVRALRAIGPLVRRAIDLGAAAIGLCFAAPILALFALLVRLESKGAAFFPQERIGRHGKPFRIWTVRSMVADAEALKARLLARSTDAVRFKIKHDPRITRIGAIIRKLSIDELPQLWNVLVGDMTLVGPRPPIRREVAGYDPRALRRLEVKPGITCLWQVRGRSDLSFEQQIELDLEYIDSVRPSQELAIVVATIPAVVTGKGAY